MSQLVEEEYESNRTCMRASWPASTRWTRLDSADISVVDLASGLPASACHHEMRLDSFRLFSRAPCTVCWRHDTEAARNKFRNAGARDPSSTTNWKTKSEGRRNGAGISVDQARLLPNRCGLRTSSALDTSARIQSDAITSCSREKEVDIS